MYAVMNSAWRCSLMGWQYLTWKNQTVRSMLAGIPHIFQVESLFKKTMPTCCLNPNPEYLSMTFRIHLNHSARVYYPQASEGWSLL